ncbi:MAG: carboxypeptidase-like regulatory domain-containing protein [Myxococcaceae bacterium]
MTFPRLLVLAAVSSIALFGCGGGTKLPDGGTTDRNVCTDGVPTMIVTVVDTSGKPVKGATVSARNVGSGKIVTGTTDDQGVTKAVTSDIGSGSIQLSATLGTQSSNVQQTEWQCGECSCTATPSSTTLTLQ